MTRPRQLILTTILLLSAYALLAVVYDDNDLVSNLSPNQVPVPMLVMHPPYAHDQDPSIHKISEKYLFLLMKKQDQIFFFTTVEQLRPYDRDHDNVIDNSDSIYNFLYVGLYNKKNNNLVYRPISKTAIRAIRLSSTTAVTERAEVIFADNHLNKSTTPLHITAEYFIEDDLKKIKTLPQT